MAGALFKAIVTIPHKLHSKGYRGQGVLFFFSTKSQAFVSEINPSYRAGLGVEPGSAAVQSSALPFGCGSQGHLSTGAHRFGNGVSADTCFVRRGS